MDLFFVLSGFILAHVHGTTLAQPTAARLARYATGRLRRVCPSNLVALAAIAVLLALDPGYAAWRGVSEFPTTSIANLALLLPAWMRPPHDLNGPVWSLSAEMVGYLALPLLVLALARTSARTAACVAVACVAAFAATRFGLHQSGTNPAAGWGALARIATCFTAGVALRRLRAAMPRPSCRLAATTSTLAVTGIVAVGSTWVLSDALPALYGVLILSLSYERGPVAAALRSLPAMIMGGISFQFYLVHMTAVSYLRYMIERHGARLDWTTFAAVLAASIAAALALKRIVDGTG